MIKCPECGTENGKRFKFCCECGCRLSVENDDTVGEVLDDKPFFSDESAKSSRVNVSEIANKNGADRLRPSDEGDDDFYDDEFFHDKGKSRKKNKHRHDYDSDRHASPSGDIIFGVVTLLLIGLIICFGYLYIDRNYDGDSFKDKWAHMKSAMLSDSLITKQPTITASETPEGEPAIIITVYARKGTIVTFREGATVMEEQVKGQSIAFRIPTSLWTAGADVADEVFIVPNVFVRDPSRSNEITKLNFTPYSTSMQTVKITLTSPDTLELVTANSTVEIEGYVSDTDVAVFMNNNQLQLDESGYFRTVYHVEKIGEQTVTFTAQKKGYVVGKQTLQVTYTESDIGVEITTPEMRTFADSIEITGIIDKGAELKVSGVELDGDVDLDSDGSFRFVAKLPQVGNYAITLTLSTEDVTASVDIYVERAPNSDDYIRESREFEYDWIVEHPTMDRHFGITGTIVEVYQSEPFVKARMRTSEGDIIFTYYHTTEITANDGKSYRIYAELDGIDAQTGLPQLYCWFINKT